jgi:hypothetical protein
MAAPDKQQKLEAKQLRDQAAGAMAAGDYKQARQLNLKVVEIAPDSKQATEARAEAANLLPDRVGLYIGAAWVGAWGLAYLLAFIL